MQYGNSSEFLNRAGSAIKSAGARVAKTKRGEGFLRGMGRLTGVYTEEHARIEDKARRKAVKAAQPSAPAKKSQKETTLFKSKPVKKTQPTKPAPKGKPTTKKPTPKTTPTRTTKKAGK